MLSTKHLKKLARLKTFYNNYDNKIHTFVRFVIKKILHTAFSAALAILVLFGSTTKEFFHGFADHEDTVHHHCGKGELSFESQHIHCDFLDDSLPPFHAQSFFPTIEIVSVNHTEVVTEGEYFLLSTTSIFPTQRGPPAIFS